MKLIFFCLILGDWSDIVSLLTPIILLFWFYYSQIQTFSKNYYSEIVGTYSDFSIPVAIKSTDRSTAYAGFIMDIYEIDNNGYFRGEMIYGETESTGSGVIGKVAATFQFYGKLNYEFYFKKSRYPFHKRDNSKYFGKLYLVDHLSVSHDGKIPDDFLAFEYNIFHYREMKVFSLSVSKICRENPKLPEKFSL